MLRTERTRTAERKMAVNVEVVARATRPAVLIPAERKRVRERGRERERKENRRDSARARHELLCGARKSCGSANVYLAASTLEIRPLLAARHVELTLLWGPPVRAATDRQIA